VATSSSPLSLLREKLRKERRTNKRLRVLIDEFREQVRIIRGDLDVQFQRIAQLQVELDATKKAILDKFR
jgi:hypothetical protein